MTKSIEWNLRMGSIYSLAYGKTVLSLFKLYQFVINLKRTAEKKKDREGKNSTPKLK